MRSAKKQAGPKPIDPALFKFLERDCDRSWARGLLPLAEYVRWLRWSIESQTKLLAMTIELDGWRLRKFNGLVKRALKAKALKSLAAKVAADNERRRALLAQPLPGAPVGEPRP